MTTQPPHDLVAEQCAIGAMLSSADAIGAVTALIRPGDFYRPAHQLICEAILALYERGDPADLVTVADLLGKRGELARGGGAVYLHDCVMAVPVYTQAGWYAKIVRDKAILRRQIEAGTRIIQIATQGDGEADELAERARREVDAILPDPSQGGQDIGDLFYKVLNDLETAAPRGLPVPWQDLNGVLNGLAAGEMVVLAARPGTGTSIAGLQTAASLALHQGEPAVIFSMEMTAEEIMLRLIAAEGRIPFHALMARQVAPEHWERIAEIQDRITKSPLVIDGSPGCSLAYARSRLRAMQRTAPARLAVFDYIQLLSGGNRRENRQVEVSEYARGIKLLAGEFGIPVIAIAQLNRMPQHRKDKRPELSDLRESGEIENAANVVILMHRDDLYERESPRAGEIDFIVAKNRNGPTCTVTAAFQGHYARIVDMAPDWTPSSAVAGDDT